jgi:DNA-binding PadR family transcriptional regulator
MSTLRFAILTLLQEQPDCGYRLKRRFDDRVGSVWHLNTGQVYQTLKALSEADLVVPLEDGVEPSDTSSKHNEMRSYELTPAGEDALEAWLHKPPTRPQPVRDETLVRLLLLRNGREEEGIDRIRGQEHMYREHLTDLGGRKDEMLDQDTDETALFGLEAAILHTSAHLKWLEYCRLRLERAYADRLSGIAAMPRPQSDDDDSQPAAKAGAQLTLHITK